MLRVLLLFLPRVVRTPRDHERLALLLRTMAEAPAEPMTEDFEHHVLDAMRAAPRGRGEEER